MRQQYIFIEPTYINNDPIGGVVLLPYPLNDEYHDENYVLKKTGTTVRGMPIYELGKRRREN